jgi:hypothetical protein
MKRDENGNYWPEPADLEQGCPCCGAGLKEHGRDINTEEYWSFTCGMLFRGERMFPERICRNAYKSAINARNHATVQEFAEWLYKNFTFGWDVRDWIAQFNAEHPDKPIEAKP